MHEVTIAYFVAREIIAHEMTLKLPRNCVKALKITLMWLDVASCDFLDVEDV